MLLCCVKEKYRGDLTGVSESSSSSSRVRGAAYYLGRCRNTFPASDKGSSLRFSARKANTGHLGDDQA